jgi:hypothetical protein
MFTGDIVMAICRGTIPPLPFWGKSLYKFGSTLFVVTHNLLLQICATPTHAVAFRPAQSRKPAPGRCFCLCALTATPLELFDWLAADVETIQAWNEAVKAFLAQERKPEALLVRL